MKQEEQANLFSSFAASNGSEGKKKRPKKDISTKTVLRAHSKAKVELYTQYLSTYLSILGNTPYISRVHIFDVMCGEGKYADNAEGSALQGLRTILAYCTTFPAGRILLSVRLNDVGQSDIEAGVKKIDRVRQYGQLIPLPERVKVVYSGLEYKTILAEVEQTVGSLKSDEKALIFIDPWGYKSIQPKQLHKLLASGHSEILLFLPVSHMYRFANKASRTMPIEEVEECMKPLKDLLEELFEPKVPVFSSFVQFIDALCEQLSNSLKAKHCSKYVLEASDKKNKYGLFFFTSNLKGLEVFVQTRWKLDPENGTGYHVRNPGMESLFPPMEQHTSAVLRLIESGHQITNHMLYRIGLERGLTTKHMNSILNQLRADGKISVNPIDGKEPPRKGANYLDYKPKRLVAFTLS